MRNLWLSLCAVSMLALESGCYQYVSTAGTRPVTGERYSLDLTDAGRVGLAERLGSGVIRVEGTLLRMTDTAYVMSVAGIETINGGSSHWSGERVSIPPQYISRLQGRELSRGRTAAAIGAAAAALGAFIATRSLLGGGTPPVTSGPGTGSGT